MKTALITGITGQDGSYLAELLLAKGYEVHGLVRRSSTVNIGRLHPVVETGRVDAVYDCPAVGDAAAAPALRRPQRRHGHQPAGPGDRARTRSTTSAAMSHVQVSFDMPEYTASTNGGGTVRLLEAIRAAKLDCRYYQASTSEMFGLTPPPQNEDVPLPPALAVRHLEGVRALVHRQLPRGVRPLRRLRDPVQPRVAAPRRELRDAQDQQGRRRDRARRAGRAGRWATSTPCATGATPRSTSRACG